MPWIKGLPVQSAISQQLRALLASETTDLSDIADLLAHEPVLSAKVLQLANSAFLGFSRSSTTIHEGVIRLGAKLVEAIVTMHSVDEVFKHRLPEILHRALTDLAFKHAALSRELAKQSGFTRTEQDQVFSAAIFSAIGRLIVISHKAPDEQREYNAALLISAARPIQKGFDDSTIVSVYMLTLWGYDSDLCNIVLWQDTPSPENNAIEKMSFILFLVKQFLLSSNKDDFDKLIHLIEEPRLSEAFIQMVHTTYA
ncbi:HDOD domain-containing protein [Arsukibacterium sp.]|uniref:HDOD domain-containing protein n=1 Tax=Arsukibacterium sp. TaxID=1977258 RepID=UPI002FD8D3AD